MMMTEPCVFCVLPGPRIYSVVIGAGSFLPTFFPHRYGVFFPVVDLFFPQNIYLGLKIKISNSPLLGRSVENAMHLDVNVAQDARHHGDDAEGDEEDAEKVVTFARWNDFC